MTDDTQPRQSRARALVISAVKVLVSVGLLYLLFSRVDVSRLWSVARQASPLWLGAALVLYLVMILASAWRWGILLRAPARQALVRLPHAVVPRSRRSSTISCRATSAAT
jgi:uncharacterized membrane protein YbhN (UPF0104 family)